MNRLFLKVIFLLSAFQICSAQEINITFEEAQQLAAANSDDLELAELGLIIANQRLDLGKRIYFPHFSLQYIDSNRVIQSEVDTKQHQVTFRIEQLLFDGGTNTVKRELARTQLALQNKALAQKYDELIDTVWSIYQNIMILEEKNLIRKQNYQLAGDQLVIVQTQLKLGTIREIDYIGTELEISSMYQEIVETEYQLDDAWFDFRRLLGIPQETLLTLAETIDTNYNGSSTEISPGDIYKFALKNNLDFSSLQTQLYQKQKEYEYLNKTYIPQLTGSLSLSFKGNALPLGSPSLGGSLSVSFPDKLFPFSTTLNASTGDNSTSVSGETSLSIGEDFTRPVSRNEIAIAMESLRIQEERFMKNMMTEIERALRSYENLKKRILLSRNSLALQYSKLRIIEKQFELGEVISLELLKTGNDIADAEVDLIEQVFAILQTERSLERLMGFLPGSFYLLAIGMEEISDE